MGDDLVLIDDSVVVPCPPRDALACLDGPQAIAAWFGVRRSGTRSTVPSRVGHLELSRERERWAPEEGVLTVDGFAGTVPFHAQLTLRAVIRPVSGRLEAGTELWVHVELGNARHARRTATIIRRVIEQGLEHIRLELDAAPDTHS